MAGELITPREFWDRKVEKIIQMFEYGAFTEEKFVSEMARWVYDRNDVEEALNDDGVIISCDDDDDDWE